MCKLGDTDKLDGMKRLERFVRGVAQRYTPEAGFDTAVAHEHAISPSLEGHSVFDDKPRRRDPQQLPLFGG